MGKNKRRNFDIDDEFLIHLDAMRADYDDCLKNNEQQRKDLQKLIALLLEHDIPIPGNIIDRYIKCAPNTDTDDQEDIPF